MNDELLQRVEHLAQAGGRLFLATAATDGTVTRYTYYPDGKTKTITRPNNTDTSLPAG